MNDHQITYAAVYGSIVFIFSLWVAFDAHAIGANTGLVRGVANMGWFAWWLGALVIFPIVFPLYLAKRPVIKVAAAAEGRGDIAKWRAVHPFINRDTGELTEPVSEVYARTANLPGADDFSTAAPAATQPQGPAFAPMAAAAAATSVVSQGFGQPAAVPTSGTVSVDPLLAAQPVADPSDLDLAVVGFPSFAAAQAARPVSFDTEPQPEPEPEPEPEPVDFMTPLKMPEPLKVEPEPGGEFDRTFDSAHSLGAAHLAESTHATRPTNGAESERSYDYEPEPAPNRHDAFEAAQDFEPVLASGTTALAEKPVGEPLTVPPLSIIPEAPKPLPPAGWYPDPANGAKLRYWDGKVWAAAQA
jgi:hypothetical protein